MESAVEAPIISQKGNDGRSHSSTSETGYDLEEGTLCAAPVQAVDKMHYVHVSSASHRESRRSQPLCSHRVGAYADLVYCSGLQSDGHVSSMPTTKLRRLTIELLQPQVLHRSVQASEPLGQHRRG